MENFFSQESGKHTFQRVPPTEKRGRLHTSIITVSVLKQQVANFLFDKSQVDESFVRSQGAGGQNVNKRSTCVQLIHRPTGIIVKCQDTRNQNKNREIAWARLEEILRSAFNKKVDSEARNTIWQQIGDGGRSDKKRTYREKDDLVIDHVTGKRHKMSKFMKGDISPLHE